ncbi:PhzF family phenazine biosynthesis protein, partial [Rhizobium ruizarguesonis]
MGRRIGLADRHGARDLLVLGDEHVALDPRDHLSETVFVQPSDNAAYAARLRIFTPGRELPFAGHP